MTPRTIALWGLASASVLAACDRFDAPEGTRVRGRREPRDMVHAELTRAMKAAEGLTISCKAGELLWEEEATEDVGPKHYSRPCIPERCVLSEIEIEALRAAIADARSDIAGDATLRVPSIEGFVSLADATLAFIETAAAAAKADPTGAAATFSGLSLHYGSMSSAFAELYDDPKFPLEPPSLKASLAAPGVGGEVCKGWGNPKYCDVASIKVPSERRWRASPACIEVESVAKPK